jgi:hypothetical protein
VPEAEAEAIVACFFPLWAERLLLREEPVASDADLGVAFLPDLVVGPVEGVVEDVVPVAVVAEAAAVVAAVAASVEVDVVAAVVAAVGTAAADFAAPPWEGRDWLLVPCVEGGVTGFDLASAGSKTSSPLSDPVVAGGSSPGSLLEAASVLLFLGSGFLLAPRSSFETFLKASPASLIDPTKGAKGSAVSPSLLAFFSLPRGTFCYPRGDEWKMQSADTPKLALLPSSLLASQQETTLLVANLALPRFPH